MDAQIIPFPSRQPAEAGADPHERLSQALQALDAALAEQRQAVANWRATLMRLQSTVHGVGEGLSTYSGSLEKLRSDVSTLNGQARVLEQWAESVLAKG